MEDGYKELIEKLHNIENIGDAPIGKHWSVLIDKSTLRDVIDVIERLVRERDAAVEDVEHLAKHPTGACDVCNSQKCQNSPLCSGGCDFEWRGVQE